MPNKATTGQDSAEMRLLGLALALTLGFALVEWLGGLYSGSLALIADAGHMVTDSSSLTITLFALWLSARPAKGAFSYGLKRVEVIAALANGLTLLALGGWILFEAWQRMGQARSIDSFSMTVIATLGLGVNLVALKILHGDHGHSHGPDQACGHNHAAPTQSLAMRSAWLHILGDILGSLGAISAGLVVYWTGYTPIDLWVSGFISLLIFVGAGRILRESLRLLLDAYPNHISNQEVETFFRQYPGVIDICDLHVWSIGSKEPILTAHLVVTQVEGEAFLAPLHHALAKRFHITHCTIQVEEKACNIGF